jgi:hypothetical protein
VTVLARAQGTGDRRVAGVIITCSVSLQIATAEMISQHALARLTYRRFLQAKPCDSRACRSEAARVSDLSRLL